MVPRLQGKKRRQRKGSSMKKMLLAVACLGMVGSANMFAKAPDLIEAIDALDKLVNAEKAIKDIKTYMAEAKVAQEPMKKAAKSILAADIVYNSITLPLETIFRGLNSNSIIAKATKGYLGKAADKLAEINVSLKDLGPIAELLAVMS